MGNLGFVKTRHRVGFSEVREALGEIVPRRFGALIEVREYPEDEEFEVGYFPAGIAFAIQLAHGQIKILHQTNLFVSWLEVVVAHELALRFHGVISEEGVGGTWHGKRNKYLHFEDYIRQILPPGNDPMDELWVRTMLRQTPRAVRHL